MLAGGAFSQQRPPKQEHPAIHRVLASRMFTQVKPDFPRPLLEILELPLSMSMPNVAIHIAQYVADHGINLGLVFR